MKPYRSYYEHPQYQSEEVQDRAFEIDMRTLQKRKELEKEVQKGFILSSATLAMMFSAGVAWAICAASKEGSFISVFAGFALAGPLTILFIIMFILTIAYWYDFEENRDRK